MAESTTVKVRRDGTITLTDSGASNTYTVAYENGNLSFNKDKAERIVIRDRGVIVGSRRGDDPVLQMSFEVHFREFTTSAATDITLCDVLDQTGNVSGWTKVSTAHEEFNFDATITIEGTDHNDAADHTATAATCIGTWEFKEGDPNTISVTLEIMGGITTTGAT